MSEEQKVGCARPTGGPVGEKVERKEQTHEPVIKEERTMIKVG